MFDHQNIYVEYYIIVINNDPVPHSVTFNQKLIRNQRI